MILGTFVQGNPGNTLVDKLISHTYGPSYYNSRITTLGGYKFYNNTALNTIDCPNVSNIGWATFQGCTNLKTANLGAVTNLQGATFSGCTNLTSLNVAWSSITAMSTNTFNGCNNLPISITNTSTIIPQGAFQGCSKMTYGSFPNATTISQNAFTLCLATEIYCPKVTTFAQEAFKQATSVLSLNFPNFNGALQNRNFESCYRMSYFSAPGITLAPLFAFHHCSSLTSIILPKCSNIQSGTFAGCINLSFAYFSWTTTTASITATLTFQSCYNLLSLYLLGPNRMTLNNVNAFNSTPISNYTTSTGGVQGSIYVPSSLYASYIAATNWITYSDRFVSMTDAEISAVKAQLGVED